MHTEFLMGNAAIAMGAIAAGLNVVSGYPGTPSTEVLETTAKHNDGSIYVGVVHKRKSGNGTGCRCGVLRCTNHGDHEAGGLNVASDPLMSLAYIGVKGGMVILVADDPGPISSQTEQDTRRFAAFSKLPCFDPSGVQEAYDMIQEAFAYSERYHTPVLFRPTTRVCHGYASITVKDAAEYQVNSPEGVCERPSKWVIFPSCPTRIISVWKSGIPNCKVSFPAIPATGSIRKQIPHVRRALPPMASAFPIPWKPCTAKLHRGC